jgi:hypothetical protein
MDTKYTHDVYLTGNLNPEYVTKRDWNLRVINAAELLEGVNEPAGASEVELVAYGVSVLSRGGFGGPPDLLVAAAREWAADAITRRCERFASTAEDFVGQREDA